MAKNKNAKIEMLEAKIDMLESKIEMLETKVKLFNTKEKIETKICTKKTYIRKYFIMIVFIIIAFILFNKSKNDVNQLINKYYAIAKDHYC